MQNLPHENSYFWENTLALSTQPLRNRSSKALLKEIKKLPVKERQLLAGETLKSIRKPTSDRIAKAVRKLKKDYSTDKELTAFTSLDSDSFYEAR